MRLPAQGSPFSALLRRPNFSQPDPMELFRKQMELVDSMGKANDPEYKQEQQRIKKIAAARKTETTASSPFRE
jgi:hypothetical protein